MVQGPLRIRKKIGHHRSSQYSLICAKIDLPITIPKSTGTAFPIYIPNRVKDIWPYFHKKYNLEERFVKGHLL